MTLPPNWIYWLIIIVLVLLIGYLIYRLNIKQPLSNIPLVLDPVRIPIDPAQTVCLPPINAQPIVTRPTGIRSPPRLGPSNVKLNDLNGEQQQTDLTPILPRQFNTIPETGPDQDLLCREEPEPIVPQPLITPKPATYSRCSKGETVCRQVLEALYQKPFPSCRPNFLKNPETGRNLEIDCYNDELKLGVEYNGKQHYHYPNSFHKTYDEFVAQVRRDQLKYDLCDRAGVYLIVVPYKVRHDQISDYIKYYLPEVYAQRLAAGIAD